MCRLAEAHATLAFTATAAAAGYPTRELAQEPVTNTAQARHMVAEQLQRRAPVLQPRPPAAGRGGLAVPASLLRFIFPFFSLHLRPFGKLSSISVITFFSRRRPI